jgi:iron-sulfur cluster repair protein YtfE (RIC family)
MKRHPALQQLSRDHHHALVVARQLQRADDDTASDARGVFQGYWERDGRAHFREEEEILLPACAGFMNADEPIIATVLTDHVRIRHLADRLAAQNPPELEVLHELGRSLAEHVRREERQLFPLIQHSIPESGLRELVARLEQ